MTLEEQQLRTVVLAQAIESADGDGKLVSAAEREQAGNAALEAVRRAAAPAAGWQPLERLERVLHLRASEIVERASVRAPALALAHLARSRLGWLAIGLPLAALLFGIATDRVANPHRVDLLSLPLIAIVAWNLVIYIVLLVNWLSSLNKPATTATAGDGAFAGLMSWANGWRSRGTGPATRVAALFWRLWQALAAAAQAERFKRTLHLAAAAWAAGIALSLLARGLVVQYQAGWESTFLEARHVHAILEVLIWPVAALFPVAPFSVEEIAGLRDFAVRGAAGARWVYLYAGLLALFVMLPRLLLAGWAFWRERVLLRGLGFDWHDVYYQDLAARLAPATITVAVVAEDRQQRAALLRLLRRHAGVVQDGDLLLATAEGDELRLAIDAETDPFADAVLLLPGVAPALPEAWRGLPVLSLTLRRIAGSWVQEQRLFEQLKSLLPRSKALGFERLRQAWEQHNRVRFDAAMRALAAHLLETARELQAGGEASIVRLSDSQARSSGRLLELHALDSASGEAVEARLREKFALQAGLSKTQAGAAGAAAGAAVGASLDAMVAFMSLGAATALGALLGGGIGVAKAAFQQKDVSDSALQALVEAALLRYLAVEHFSRIGVADGAIDPAWKSETVAAVAAQWKNLTPLLAAARRPDSTPAAEAQLAEALEAMTLKLLGRLYLERPEP